MGDENRPVPCGDIYDVAVGSTAPKPSTVPKIPCRQRATAATINSTIDSGPPMDISTRLVISQPLYSQDSTCGYCHGTKRPEEATSLPHTTDTHAHGSSSVGFQVRSMTAAHYDQLINLGYRRSGHFVYKPDLLRSCCRMHTIRTNWTLFSPSKEHRRDVGKFNKQLRVGEKTPSATEFEKSLGLMDSVVDVRFEGTAYSKEKYAVFKKYQEEIHHDDDCSPKGFKRFLCDSPLNQARIEDGQVQEFGSVHQCWYFEDKLIAIGVLDILPSGVSSVYFLYDPDYKHLTLGKISGLREMLMTKQLGLEWYYLGYYIQDCQKMAYKGKYGGQLRNPLDGKYYDLKLLETKITKGKLFAFDGEKDVVTELYGDDGTEYKNAEEALKALNRSGITMDCTTTYRHKGDYDDIPGVIPGCLTLKQLANEVERLKTYKLTILIQQQLAQVDIMDLTPQFQQLVVDLVRLLGWELFKECVVT